MPTEPTDHDYRSMSGIAQTARVAGGVAVGFALALLLILVASFFGQETPRLGLSILFIVVGGFLGWWLRMYSPAQLLCVTFGLAFLAIVVGCLPSFLIGDANNDWCQAFPAMIGIGLGSAGLLGVLVIAWCLHANKKAKRKMARDACDSGKSTCG